MLRKVHKNIKNSVYKHREASLKDRTNHTIIWQVEVPHTSTNLDVKGGIWNGRLAGTHAKHAENKQDTQ